MSHHSADLISARLAPVAAPARRGSLGADRLFNGVLLASAWLILALVIALLGVLFAAALPAIKAVGLGIFATAWSPTDGQFGVLSFVFGTAVTSAIALLLAGPVGVAVALFLSELAPRRL